MRKILSVFAVLAIVVFTACEKEQIEEPGNIPGMGDNESALSVDAFDLPEGIELVGSMTGVVETTAIAVDKNDLSLKTTFTNEAVQSSDNFGSGGQFVKLKCHLRNTTNQRRTVFFPRGLICKVNLEDYQSGVLLQWAWVSVAPNASREFVLHLYCINKGKHGSDATSKYSILGITNSNVMWKLINRIGWKMVNWEHYYNGTSTAAVLKQNSLTYEEVTEGLQDAVWSMTNGDGLSESQIEFIESIPSLNQEDLPADLINGTIDPLKYYPEYGE
ncbi:hypothetical protein [Carboxylicivirga linearis]|uniref:Lipoprotein n=1 Tax=Carboxylicivirga linearis TaxID=1628157 RepID=A0ABS5JW25_9BACT|nr:hypothetical protein [Carboxylicivirga linearis]MBS2099100.1 hypothetical protein [Carboxylicivirga linearis]